MMGFESGNGPSPQDKGMETEAQHQQDSSLELKAARKLHMDLMQGGWPEAKLSQELRDKLPEEYRVAEFGSDVPPDVQKQVEDEIRREYEDLLTRP